MLATHLLVLHSGHFPSSLITIAYPYHSSTIETLHTLTNLNTVTITTQSVYTLNSPLCNIANCSLTSPVFVITTKQNLDWLINYGVINTLSYNYIIDKVKVLIINRFNTNITCNLISESCSLRFAGYAWLVWSTELYSIHYCSLQRPLCLHLRNVVYLKRCLYISSLFLSYSVSSYARHYGLYHLKIGV